MDPCLLVDVQISVHVAHLLYKVCTHPDHVPSGMIDLVPCRETHPSPERPDLTIYHVFRGDTFKHWRVLICEFEEPLQ